MINEYEDCKLFTELGHDIISQGWYNNPLHPSDDARPPIPGMPYFPDLNPLARKLTWIKRIDIIPQRLIDWADAIYILGIEKWLPVNWDRIRHKKVVFRSIGQSSQRTESVLANYRPQGLHIVRYSELEEQIPEYAGSDAMIRFYKDENEYRGWMGGKKEVITVARSVKRRARSLKFEIFDQATLGFPRRLYGMGNDDVGELWGWRLSYEDLKRTLRENRVYFYTCTFPAPYTMAFIEAWMTGIPVVAIGPRLAEFGVESQNLINPGVDGYVSDDIVELRKEIKLLLEDYDVATKVSQRGRAAAIKYFGIEQIRRQWKLFWETI